jgi:hypothetical protein
MPNGADLGGFLLQGFEGGFVFHRKGVEMRLRGLLPLPLAAPENEHIEEAVPQGMATQRCPACLGIRRKELRPVVHRVEIFANDQRVVERRAIVQH